MKYLLDTHTFLWFVTGDTKLSPQALSTIENNGNEIYFSAASAWEIAIKNQLGRLRIQEDLELFITNQLVQNGFRPLSITIIHTINSGNLPLLHKDPFDRILISQSVIENMPLISTDTNIKRYAVQLVW
jgi:PIN domain nuclease of toxin-antitoxin system